MLTKVFVSQSYRKSHIHPQKRIADPQKRIADFKVEGMGANQNVVLKPGLGVETAYYGKRHELEKTLAVI